MAGFPGFSPTDSTWCLEAPSGRWESAIVFQTYEKVPFEKVPFPFVAI